MKKILVISLFLYSFYYCIVTGEEVNATSSSYCVMSMNDDKILASSNKNYTQSVASISKIMTAIVAIENGNLNDQIIVDDSIYSVEGSMLYLKEKEVYSLEDLLYGLMLRSGNDAATLIARHIGGSEKNFVSMMNDKAKEIGMNATIFSNPSGLDEDGGNISSSCDMALLTSYAMKNKIFRTIVSTKQYSPDTNKLWKNKNRFLFSYPDATGGKTGFTKKAGRTLVTTSKRGNMEIVVVSIRMDDDFNFHEKLHEEAYKQYESELLVEASEYLIDHKKVDIFSDIFITHKKGAKTKVYLKGKFEGKQFVLDIKDKKKRRRLYFNYE